MSDNSQNSNVQAQNSTVPNRDEIFNIITYLTNVKLTSIDRFDCLHISISQDDYNRILGMTEKNIGRSPLKSVHYLDKNVYTLVVKLPSSVLKVARNFEKLSFQVGNHVDRMNINIRSYDFEDKETKERIFGWNTTSNIL